MAVREGVLPWAVALSLGCCLGLQADDGSARQASASAAPKVVFRIDGGSPDGFGRTYFAEQKQPKPVLERIVLPSGRHALRLTAKESCTGSWRVPFRLAEKTRYRVECEVSVEPGAERGSQSLVVEHNLGGCVVAPWAGTTNITFEINSLGEDSGLLQYRLRGFKGTLVFSKVIVSQIGPEGAEPASLHDQNAALFDACLYRYAVPGDRPDESYASGWAVDPELTRKLKGALDGASGLRQEPSVPGRQLIYALTDQRLIPSAFPERLEEKGIAAVTLLEPPPGRPVTGDERYYKVTLVKPFSWVPREGAKTEKGAKKQLLNRPGHVLHLYLHERGGHVVEYGIGGLTGPTVFYRDPAGKPVLPANDILRSLPLPCLREGLDSSGTGACSGDGVLGWEYRSRELDRSLLLLGARQLAPEIFPEGVVLRLDPALRIGVTAKMNNVTPEFVGQMAAAGANLLLGAGLALGPLRSALETAPLWVCGFSPFLAVDEFDAYRSNFLSVGSYIDEPYERSTDWDEYVKKHEVQSWEDLARLFPQRIRTEGRERRSFFPREPSHAFDTLPAMADLHFRAGVSAFWFEHYAPARMAEELRRRTGESFTDLAAANRGCFAPMRGAAFQHGRSWGIGVWVTDPARNSSGGGQWEDARATLLQAWQEGARDLIFYSESDAATANALKWIRILRQDLATARRAIPAGGHAPKAIAVMPGFLGGGKFGLGTYPPLDTEANRRLWSAFNRQFAAFANSGEAFDVITDDAPRAAVEKYRELWRLRDRVGAD